MDLQISIQESPALKRMLGDRFPSMVMRTIFRATSTVMWKVLLHHRTKQMTPYSGTPSAYGFLNIRRGDLLKSFKAHVSQNVSKATVTGEYGTRMKRFAILERGGRISGRPWLTVPLHDNQPSARQMRSSGLTFIRKSRAGHLIIWRRRGSESPEPVFVLKRMVRIKERRTLMKTMDAKKQEGAREITTAVRLLMSRGF